MIDYQEIGNNIKICRIRCNLKQAELAEMVGVTSQHISHVERCQTKPSLTLLVDISTALRVDLYTLLGSNIPVHPDVSISVEEVVIGATSAADPLSCIVERRIANEPKTIPKQIHFDAAYAGNAFDTVPYRSLCRGYGG